MKIILFDGECSLCNSTIQYVIKHDRNDVFRFTPLQSKLGKEICTRIGVSPINNDTSILYINDNKYYTKSSAAIEVAKNLDSFWKIIIIFKIFPSKIRDYIYDFIAKNRYNWFKNNNNCRLTKVNNNSKIINSINESP